MAEQKTSITSARIPFISDEALDTYAEEITRDFMPDSLKKPVQFEVERFLEFYLGLQMEYKRLSYDRRILGMTIFNDGRLDVIDDSTGQKVKIPVNAGTVIIEPSLTLKRNTARRRFASVHEGSHWLRHREYFADDDNCNYNKKNDCLFVAAKEGRIDYSRCQKQRTDSDRMERQADFLSSAFLMPKLTLRMVYREFFLSNGDKARHIIRGASPADDVYAKLLPEYVAKVYNVSKRAALIRMEKLNAIVDIKSSICF